MLFLQLYKITDGIHSAICACVDIEEICLSEGLKILGRSGCETTNQFEVA